MAMGDGSQSNVKLVRMDHDCGLHYYHKLQLEVVDPVLPLHLLCWLGLHTGFWSLYYLDFFLSFSLKIHYQVLMDFKKLMKQF